jgi:hypothetical protein
MSGIKTSGVLALLLAILAAPGQGFAAQSVGHCGGCCAENPTHPLDCLTFCSLADGREQIGLVSVANEAVTEARTERCEAASVCGETIGKVPERAAWTPGRLCILYHFFLI